MEITFLGGADEIGASSYLLEVGGKKLLIDAGIRMNERMHREKIPDFSLVDSIDAIFLTHAHTDHSGALPIIAFNQGKESPIYMTSGSFQLCTVLYKDALKLMNNLDKEEEVPLYGEEEIFHTFSNIRQVDLNRPFIPFDDIQVTFFPAGHILGAACIYIQSKEGNILFTGDFSLSNQISVPGVAVKASPDIVVTEATYGGRQHIDRNRLEKECIFMMKRVLEREGKIIIPAFAIGRSQEMILLLKKAFTAKSIPKTDVYVDGMINSVNLVYGSNPWSLTKSLQSIMKNKQDLFYDRYIQRVSPPQREKIVQSDNPMVIISSSGMLIGGPSVYYAQRLLDSENNALFISGYQDEESPGRRLLELSQGDNLILDKKEIKVTADIFKFSFSAHADENQISAFVNSLSPREVILVHGEEDARKSLRGKFVCNRIISPKYQEVIKFRKYRKPVSFRATNFDENKIKINDYWNRCLELGINRVHEKELLDLFEERTVIDGFDGFVKDYRDKSYYMVLSPQEIERNVYRKKTYETLGDLREKLVAYSVSQKREIAYCKDVDPEHLAYHLLSAKKGKSRTRIDVRMIVHVFDYSLENQETDDAILKKLREMKGLAKKRERRCREILLKELGMFSFDHAQEITAREDVIDDIAIVFALIPISKKNENGMYKIKSDVIANEIKQSKPDDESIENSDKFNTSFIMSNIRSKLKDYALKRVSYKDNLFSLYFDFPLGLDRNEIAKHLENDLPEGCEFIILDRTNTNAFRELFSAYLGKYSKVSIYKEERKVIVSNSRRPFPENFETTFFQKTGFTFQEDKNR